MAIKKSELYASIWSSSDQLRSAMDASQYKDCVLMLLFVMHHPPAWPRRRAELNVAALAAEAWSRPRVDRSRGGCWQ